jgi:hypothetical protein
VKINKNIYTLTYSLEVGYWGHLKSSWSDALFETIGEGPVIKSLGLVSRTLRGVLDLWSWTALWTSGMSWGMGECPRNSVWPPVRGTCGIVTGKHLGTPATLTVPGLVPDQ